MLKVLKVPYKYSITFPNGRAVVMTLKSIHESRTPYCVKYIFIDNSDTVIKFTERVCERLRIKEYSPDFSH